MKRINSGLVLAFVYCLWVGGLAVADTDFNRVQGSWTAVDKGGDGLEMTVHGGSATLVIIGQDGSSNSMDAKIQLEETKSPKQIDILDVGGQAGSNVLGIYELNSQANALNICLDMSGQGRPTTFDGCGDADKKSGTTFLTFKRK